MTLLLQFPRVHFGYGAINKLTEALATTGISRPLVVTDRGLVNCGVYNIVRNAITGPTGVALFPDVPENPTLAGVEQAFRLYEVSGCDGVVAVGGGSVIDTAKAVCVLATHPGPFADYLGHPEKLNGGIASLIAIPTTAGTGSEASPASVIHPDPNSRTKGLSSPLLIPDVAICDPELTLTLPARLTAGSGIDALSHCVEGFLSRTENPPLEAMALDGISRVFASLEKAVENGQDRDARWQLMMAALEGGMSISMGLGPTHALATTFGDRGLHHGALIAACLPVTLRLIAPHAPQKMQLLAAAMGLTADGSPADAVAQLAARVNLPSTLRQMNYPQKDIDEMAVDAAASFFNGHSPYAPSIAEYKEMVREIIG